MKRLAAVFWLVSVTSVFAQQPVPTVPVSVTVLVLPAAGDPNVIGPVMNGTRSTPIAAATNCNFAALPAPPAPLINPTTAEFDDPFTAGRKCRAPLPIDLPNQTGLRVVAVFVNAAGVSGDRSAVGVPPFNTAGTPAPPVAPTGVGVRP